MNGTDKLKILFKNQDDFIEFFIKNCFFISTKSVEERAKEMLKTIQLGEKLPIRYGRKLNALYKVNGAKALHRKNKKEITNFANMGMLRFKEGNLPVSIDPTGNQAIVNAINQATKHSISTFDSTIINFTISHIWEGTTNNPLFFSSLWNIVIIPNFLNYIMDKPKNQDPINEIIQETMKAICYKLYNPNKIMNSYVKIEKPKEEFWEIAEKAIKNNWINYLPENVDISSQIEETIEEEKELTSIGDLDFSDGDNFEKKLDIINRLDNKEFIFNLLNISVEYGIFDDLYPILINENLCKEYFMQKYPVLVESTNEVDKLRYYQKDLFEYEGKSYYVTNDWYQDTSKNARKNRTPFILMVKEMVLRS